MPKLKTGEQISWKEALVRFKKGVEDISPIQKLQNQTRGHVLMIIGFLVSLIAVIIKRNDIGLLSYGLILIFLGSLFNSITTYLSLRQQIKFIKSIDVQSEVNFDDIITKEEIKNV
jgi:hypothetical protein